MSSFDSKINLSVSPSIIDANPNNPNNRHILKEFDLDNGMTEVVEYVEKNRLYRMVHDITGFIQNTVFTITPRGWKKIGCLPNQHYNQWYRDLLHDDIKYLEFEESHAK